MPANWQKKVFALLCRENGKRKDLFFRFPHWVTQFHAPLAYLGWRTMKSVQFWDFRGTVFWNLLRYVAILLSPPLDRLHYYETVAKVKLWWWYVPYVGKLVFNCNLNRNYWTNQMIQLKASIHFVTSTCFFHVENWDKRRGKMTQPRFCTPEELEKFSRYKYCMTGFQPWNAKKQIFLSAWCWTNPC